MSPVLDATEIQDETELTEAEDTATETAIETTPENPAAADPLDPRRIRSITLDPPAECETAVVLLIQQDEHGLYNSGARIVRAYETSPYDKILEWLPIQDPETTGVDNLGEAVQDAVDRATWLIVTNSDESDEKASVVNGYVESWPDSMPKPLFKLTNAIFDKSEGAAEDATGQEPSVIPEELRIPSVNPDGKPIKIETPVAVTDEAQRHHDTRCNELAWEIANAHRELAKAKARVKSLTKVIDAAVDELETAEEDGPEELPLFDQCPEQSAEGEPHDSSDCTCSTCAAVRMEKAEAAEPKKADPVSGDSEAWQATLLSSIDGIPEKILDILAGHDIRTLGDWVSAPLRLGCEYSALKGITEKRLEKIQDAMDTYWAANPRDTDAATATTNMDAE